MDSLTQIVLGAACGEAVLGRKIGNKALLFGAIGGTIPDLDVFVGNLIFDNQIDVTLFHRGFMHSLTFAVLGAFIFGWTTYKLYNTQKRLGTTTVRAWIWMFFLALLTHSILDSFTPYGTQLFVPFSNYRVAFNNIAVVDVFYTLPFLICLIILMFFSRKSKKRQQWIRLGLGLSSIYMCLTLVNRFYVDSIFETSLDNNNINYSRYFVQPSLFSNFLWYGVAETPENYIYGYYSIFDKKREFISLKELPKQRDLSPNMYAQINDLAWFSNNYFSVYMLKNGNYQYNDLRYPLAEEGNPNSAVFSFELFKEGERLNMKPFERSEVDFKEILKSIFTRTKGI
ncbi:metal-dependent hydrolase [Seonamhaeicola marinus]|uniref:Metal-dependent hydrolase n=1 Tax=Seonamhaeicola marinus TaxID=1912246 RepID=A0A5D0HKJ4_9FLAO|nr:metal-dependent hydrolase [Seonamhaeicola marinus]TYA71775.1 metal-dependent hydrolase [Seonamhaeicola marinus]